MCYVLQNTISYIIRNSAFSSSIQSTLAFKLAKCNQTTFLKCQTLTPITHGWTCVGNFYMTDERRRSMFKKTTNDKDRLVSKTNAKRAELRLKGENIVNDLKYRKQIAQIKINKKKEIIVQDILATKSKVKEKLEEIIERENIYTIPNFLCVARIVLSPFLGYVILLQNYHLAFGLWIFAGFTDLVDGWIARTWISQSSKMGSFLDPMADKVLVATLFLTLTYQQLIPIPLTCLIVARDVILLTAGFVIRYKSLPPPRTLSRYFDVTHATAQLAPTFISKVNTAIQLSLVGSTLGAPVFSYIDHPVLQCLWVVTAISTISAGLSYVIANNTYKFVGKNISKKR